MMSTFGSTAKIVSALCLAALIAIPLVTAGDLNPLGTPASTMVTLDQIDAGVHAAANNARDAETAALAAQDPRTPVHSLGGSATARHAITGRGSYYLTNDIEGQTGVHGIEISASDVTLDLNGFTVIGRTGTLDGIRVVEGAGGTSRRNITIMNGTVERWDGNGIDARLANSSQFRNLRLDDNEEEGLEVGEDCLVQGCTVTVSGTSGIKAEADCVIRDCVTNGNGTVSAGNGITANSDSVLVVNCTSGNNSESGISAGPRSLVIGCHTYSNGGGTTPGRGIIVGTGSIVENCTANLNGLGDTKESGIHAGAGATVRGCSAEGNGEEGFDLSTGATLEACTARSNGNNGIFAWEGATVRGCTSSNNGRHGIQLNNLCRAIGNTCVDNDVTIGLNGASIDVIGAGNVIEGNVCIGAFRGIDLAGTGVIDNLVLGNRIHGATTSFNGTADDHFAPAFDLTANPYPANPDPNTNWVY
jgi:parallel beta helix pectate lyase-like protein